MIKSKFGNPPHHICYIWNDDGLCRNNIFSSDYDIDFSDYLDCMGYIKSKKSKRNVILKFLKTIKLFSLFLIFVLCIFSNQIGSFCFWHLLALLIFFRKPPLWVPWDIADLRWTPTAKDCAPWLLPPTLRMERWTGHWAQPRPNPSIGPGPLGPQ